MFWMAAIAWGVMYVVVLAGIILFFAGAARADERWEKANAEFVEARSNEGSAA